MEPLFPRKDTPKQKMPAAVQEIFQGLEEAVMGDHPAEHAQLIICTKKNDSREKRKKEKPDLVTDDLAHLLKHPFEAGTVPIRLFSMASGVGETVDFSIEVHLAFFQGEPAHPIPP